MEYYDVVEWDDLERVWDYVYEKKLRVTPEEVGALDLDV